MFSLEVARTEDVIETRTKVFKGRVTAVGPSGVKIQLAGGGEITVPRTEIIRIEVAPPPSVERGIAAYEKGNMREARVNLDKTISQFLGLDTEWAAKAILYSGRASLLSGDYDSAGKAFDAFLKAYPDNPHGVSASAGLADIELENKNYETALAKFQELAGLYEKQLKPPRDQWQFAAEVFLGIGKCHEGLSQPDKAMDGYARVIGLYQVEPYYSEALFRAAALLSAGGSRIYDERAVKMLSELVEKYPSSKFAVRAIEMRGAISKRMEGSKEE